MKLRQRYVVVAILDGKVHDVFEPLSYSEAQAIGFVKQLIKNGDLASRYSDFNFSASPKGLDDDQTRNS